MRECGRCATQCWRGLAEVWPPPGRRSFPFFAATLRSTPGRSPMALALAWATPFDLTSLDGLGGGLAWAEDDALCRSLMDRFEAETMCVHSSYFLLRIPFLSLALL